MAAAKRKLRKTAKDPAQAGRPKRQCRKVERDISRTDILKALSLDCVVMILEYLDFADLARLDQVSTAWRRFVHEWMVSSSAYTLRLPENLRPDLEGLQNAEQVRLLKRAGTVSSFKDRLANPSGVECARSGNILSGKASITHDFKHDYRTQISGDWAVFLDFGRHRRTRDCWALLGQHLGLQEDGSAHPVRKFAIDGPFNSGWRGFQCTYLSPGGYLVARMSDFLKPLMSRQGTLLLVSVLTDNQRPHHIPPYREGMVSRQHRGQPAQREDCDSGSWRAEALFDPRPVPP